MQEQSKCIASMDFVNDWKTWRETLSDNIGRARSLGVSEDTIKSMAVRVGNYLSENVCPGTKEEQVLKELWDVGSPEERKCLASMIFKSVTGTEH
ncbi:DUF3243 domain-containing protein [Desulfocurvibacter africanus]|uniref:DUF3243 domain-containing protein n=1 Tax=Desulfocurvibacter africanus subsp. africanus str. Walvis Bay TaxID=690850 RepID=F3Z0L3_DESAF|nr:DUF3243 domain-containing protein [Desulfocurvibacter africanus]EGJ49837.1 hypothetical protein Desaf_1500 [Desulfocurvibacter africanus subsp. africanus str. Walvis Bay]